MYSGFMLINSDFLKHFSVQEQDAIKSIIYSYYVRCGSGTRIGRKLPKDAYFASQNTRYKFVVTYCPRCRKTGVLLTTEKRADVNGLKYCGFCGEQSISYRYSVGYEKIRKMIGLYQVVEEMGLSHFVTDLNQQTVTLLRSVFEVYLRDCYAGILNAKFVSMDNSLFEKFIKDCKNDFLNPGKANERFRKELGVDVKKLIGKSIFSKLVELAEYRNVIIHNNGICDEHSEKTGFGGYHVHDTIIIERGALQSYLDAIETTVRALDAEYSKAISQCMISETKLRLAICPKTALPLALMPGQVKMPKKNNCTNTNLC